MEKEEYNDIVTYIQDQKYPQNAETRFTSITTVYWCEEDNETESES